MTGVGEKTKHVFDRVEITCPDDRWHEYTGGALHIAGQGVTDECLSTLVALLGRFPELRKIVVRRHDRCGFQLRVNDSGERETLGELLEALSEEFGYTPTLHLFTDPVRAARADVRRIVRTMRLPVGCQVVGVVTDFDTRRSRVVETFPEGTKLEPPN